jgi:hypothetical protein
LLFAFKGGAYFIVSLATHFPACKDHSSAWAAHTHHGVPAWDTALLPTAANFPALSPGQFVFPSESPSSQRRQKQTRAQLHFCALFEDFNNLSQGPSNLVGHIGLFFFSGISHGLLDQILNFTVYFPCEL